MRRFILTSFLIVVAVFAAGGVSTARAAFPGANGLIAFDDRSTHNIYTVTTTGTQLKKLTTDGQSISPRWSANGKLIAFSRLGNIWVMNANGTGAHQVTTGKHAFQPAFSPNGKTIIFVHVPAGQPGQIWSVPATGGTGKLLVSDTGCGDAHPVYSPLGTMIAYDQTGCATRVVIYRLATKVRHYIADSVNPDFSADGTYVLFSSDNPDFGAFWFDGYTASVNGTNVDGPLTFDSCTEGDPCFFEASAGPSGAFVWVDTTSVNGGQNPMVCLSNSGGDGGFCRNINTYPFPENLDWQPKP